MRRSCARWSWNESRFTPNGFCVIARRSSYFHRNPFSRRMLVQIPSPFNKREFPVFPYAFCFFAQETVGLASESAGENTQSLITTMAEGITYLFANSIKRRSMCPMPMTYGILHTKALNCQKCFPRFPKTKLTLLEFGSWNASAIIRAAPRDVV